MSNRLLLTLIVMLAALIPGLALFWQPEAPAPVIAKPHAGRPAASTPASGGEFTLQAANGPVSLQQFRGKVVLLYFGYTYCPDICPTSLIATSAALNLLSPAERAGVQTIFVSVDPERDTPARLKDYVAFFHPTIIGATGTPAEIASLARNYGASFAKQQPDGSSYYVVDHSALTYLISPQGKLVANLPHAVEPAQAAATIRQWLPPSPSTGAKQ